MSSTVKIVIGVVALVVVAAALYFGIQWYEGKYGEGSAVFSTEPVVLPSGDSTTDDSLAEDAAAIDAELKALGDDSASVDASIEESAQVQ
jgi:hypothetical protein